MAEETDTTALRDGIAARVLPALASMMVNKRPEGSLLQRAAARVVCSITGRRYEQRFRITHDVRASAGMAYAYADAMLEERSRKRELPSAGTWHVGANNERVAGDMP